MPTIKFGTYTPPPSPEYFVRGWWTDEEDHEIKEAHVGDLVRFHVQTKNINNPASKQITVSIYEEDLTAWSADGMTLGVQREVPRYSPLKEAKTEVEVNAVKIILDKEGKGCVEMYLGPDLEKMFGFELGVLEFYTKCSYFGDGKILPESSADYLKVRKSIRDIFVGPAVPGYTFPEVRSKDGCIVLISQGVGVEENTALDEKESAKIQDLMGQAKEELLGAAGFDTGELLGKLQKTIAIRELKKGNLVANTGDIYTRQKLYKKVLFDIDGGEYTVIRANNRGFMKEGKLVSTKGIDQLASFKEIGPLNRLVKSSRYILEVFDIFDIPSLMKVASGEQSLDKVSFGWAPLDFVASLANSYIFDQYKEIEDYIVEKEMEKALDSGLDAVGRLILDKALIGKSYEIVTCGQETLNQLLKGKTKTYAEFRNKFLKDRYDYTTRLYSLLFYRERGENDSIKKHILKSIFV